VKKKSKRHRKKRLGHPVVPATAVPSVPPDRAGLALTRAQRRYEEAQHYVALRGRKSGLQANAAELYGQMQALDAEIRAIDRAKRRSKLSGIAKAALVGIGIGAASFFIGAKKGLPHG
jgi:hypothetical protein